MSIFTRAAFAALSAITLTVASSNTAAAQSSPDSKSWELRISSGYFVPMGEHRDFVKNAQITAAQVSWLVRPQVAVTGTFAWARSRDLAEANDPKLDVFTSDVGVEVRSDEWFTDGPVAVSTFAGVGMGARSYNHRKLDVDATSTLAGYASVGGELGMGRVGMRIEVRDYATGYRPLVGGGASDVRNDVAVTIAFRFDR